MVSRSANDRLIEDPNALYITFDNVEVGRMEARAVYGPMPRGNYAIIKGNKSDANADFLRGGYDDVIGNAVTSGDIKIVRETYTDNWDPAKAQTEMEQILTQTGHKVDAVLSETMVSRAGSSHRWLLRVWRGPRFRSGR